MITRKIGLDIGDKRIGIAVSDPSGILASPLTIIDGDNYITAINAILDVIDKQQVTQIIIGLPLVLDGSIGIQAKKVKEFTQKLRQYTKITIKYRDERLTTVSANRLMQNVTGKKAKNRLRKDAIAAALILQGYLDESH
ncbi:Holliday junction resolvase RuvX [Chloroflexota bacterium]